MEGEETAVVDSPVEETAEVITDSDVSTETADTDVAGATTDPENQPNEQDQDSADNRTLPRDVQRALKSLRENPETAKVARALNDSYFREQAYTKVFSKPADAMAAKSTLDLVGGQEGIASMQQQIEVMRAVDQDIEEGRPEFLDDIIESSPDGFKKLAPHVLNKLYALDKQAYGTTVAPVILNTLAGYRIMGANGEPDVSAIKQLVNDLQETVKESKNRAEDPNAGKQKEEWEKIYGEKESSHYSTAQAETVATINAEISKGLAPLLKSKPLGPEAKKDLVEGINAQIGANLKANKAYMDHTAAIRAKIKQGIRAGKDVSGDVANLKSYIKAQIEEDAPKAVRAVWNRRYGAVPTKKAAPGGESGGNATPQGFLPKEPHPSQLDRVSNWKELFMQGKGFIKGKAVRWKKG